MVLDELVIHRTEKLVNKNDRVLQQKKTKINITKTTIHSQSVLILMKRMRTFAFSRCTICWAHVLRIRFVFCKHLSPLNSHILWVYASKMEHCYTIQSVLSLVGFFFFFFYRSSLLFFVVLLPSLFTSHTERYTSTSVRTGYSSTDLLCLLTMSSIWPWWLMSRWLEYNNNICLVFPGNRSLLNSSLYRNRV